MQQSIRRFTMVAGALALAWPALSAAQQPAPRIRELPRADATRILNLRRVLDLTPRQVAQLDSIERVQVAERRAMVEQARQRRDSLGGGAAGRMVPARAGAAGAVRRGMVRDSIARMTPEARQAMRDSVARTARARMDAMRPQMEQMRQRDSVRRAAAERVLNDAQRQRLRELQAEARGRQQGLREARMRQGAARRQGPAMRGQTMRDGRPGAAMRAPRPAPRGGAMVERRRAP